MQIPILVGREIDERDQAGAPQVAIVNEVFARVHFGSESPVGHRFSFGGPAQIEIVGMAKNARYDSLTTDIPPTVYLPYRQNLRMGRMTFALRTTGNPLTYVNNVRQVLEKIDPRVPLSEVRTQAAQIDQTIGQPITFARLCSAFAILALVIACVGLYATVAYNVTRRTNEIGIRLALGAQPGRVVWMVLRQITLLVGVGIAIGLPIAYSASRLVRSFLFGMKPNDPMTLILAVGLLLVSAVAAGYAPARRASQIDPLTALRHE
jgi:macrolide transport system ATP-binding/permease protein